MDERLGKRRGSPKVEEIEYMILGRQGDRGLSEKTRKVMKGKWGETANSKGHRGGCMVASWYSFFSNAMISEVKEGWAARTQPRTNINFPFFCKALGSLLSHAHLGCTTVPPKRRKIKGNL